MQSPLRLAARFQHGHGDVGLHAGQFGNRHGFQRVIVVQDGVKDDAGIDRADLHIVGHFVDGRLIDGRVGM